LIDVQTLGTAPPTICPYCRQAMVQSTLERTVAPPMAPPSPEEVKARLKAIYHPPHFIFGFIVAVGAVGLLAWAVTVQLNSIENYFYQPLVSIYSIIAGIFVITRFIFAAFYKAPAEADFEPTLTVLVPCFNEGLAIRKTLERIFSSGYPLDKLEVVCVNDGSSDDSLVHIQEAQTNHPGLVLVNFEKNRGLCHGWGVATFLARGEFMVCVDSDTFVFPGSLHKLMQGFVDPTVGGISGHCDIENANVNMLTRMQDVRYYFSYKIMKAAESVFGTVSCLPGCFSAYRRTCVLAVMDDWINATVWGKHGNYADDRSLTNLILRDYKILYDDQALATTICPEGWKQYARQQARWVRSYLREIWKTGKFMWRKHPVPALSWYAMMWMPIVEPVVMVQALVIAPLQEGMLHPSYVIGVFTITLVWSLHFWITSGRRWWYAGILFTLSYIFFFGWQTYWGFLTLDGKKWGTRG
jgi:hyaluronan synthase